MKKTTELRKGTLLQSNDAVIILTTDYSPLQNGWQFAEAEIDEDGTVNQGADIGWLVVDDLTRYELV